MAFPLNVSFSQLNIPGATPPSDVQVWLANRGWYSMQEGGTTVFSHSSYNVSECTWEQAVAYEFFRFVSLGGG